MAASLDIRQLKAAHRIEDVITGCGIALVKNGTRLKARCPFPDHQDKTPSFFVFPRTQTFQCFGRCGRGGDVLDFLQEWHGCSFREALAMLSGGSQPPPSTGSSGPPRSRGVRLAVRHHHLADLEPVEDETASRSSHVEVLTLASELYHRTLLRHPEVLDYAEDRGISQASVRSMQLGYADGHALPAYLAAHARLREAARSAGLVSDEGREQLSGRLIFPERRSGNTCYLIGRIVPPHRSRYKYLGLSLPKPLLGYGDALATTVRHRGILVTEGAVDRVIALQWGLPVYVVSLVAAWASMGQVRELLDLLERLCCTTILLGLDNDDPGQTATIGLLTELREIGVPTTVVPYPAAGGKDLGDLGLFSGGSGLYLPCLRQALAIGERL
ncbi:MAG: CHC2 zinc finger domain-containing protein [Streptosporangiaceae bacterium]